MKRALLLAAATIVTIAGVLAPVTAVAQNSSPLAGVWSLDRSQSEFPREMGFNVNWLPPSGGDDQSSGSGGSGGGRGRRSTGGGSGRGAAGPFTGSRESSEDARRVQMVTTEARNPAARLMVVDTPAAVTITNELGQSRTVHPTGREEALEIQGVPITATSSRDGDRLVVVYHVEKDRDLRYTYSFSANPSRLVVELQFLEHGAGDKATRIYGPGLEKEAAASKATAGPAPAGQSAPPGQPASGREAFDQRPGAEFKGLKSLGVLVEDFGAEAVACGLSHDTIESALAKRLTDAGLTVRRNSDDDTYVYVNVITNSGPNNTCTSRYDAFLYTHATARLSYREQPVLVQVSLIHRGGIGSSTAAGHAGAITRGLEGYVDLFVGQIRDANK